LFGHRVLALLRFAQAFGLAGARCQRVHGEVGRGVGHQVQVSVTWVPGWLATQAATTWAVSWRETDWAPVMAESM
jgi:hypothetical protein